jgi:hypothetical protein
MPLSQRVVWQLQQLRQSCLPTLLLVLLLLLSRLCCLLLVLLRPSWHFSQLLSAGCCLT